nr:hypothetical protein [Mycobacterium gordonae]
MNAERVTGRAFDKFGWLKALRADPRLTDRDVRMALALCTDYSRRDGTGWAVDLDDLATAIPSGLSRNRLKDMLQKLTEYGYLVETGRTAGGRGVVARRSHDLAKPALAAVRVNDETRTASGAGNSETRTASGSNPHRWRFKPAPLAVQKVAPELHEDPPTGTSPGTPSGTAAAHDPEPPRFCPNHPTGTRQNCRPCGDHRSSHEAWQARHSERSRVEAQARRDAIARCPDCDEFGQVDLGEAVANCRHPNLPREQSA